MSEYFGAFRSLSPFKLGSLSLLGANQLFLRYLPLDSLLETGARFNLLPNDIIKTCADAIDENRTFSLEFGTITCVDGFKWYGRPYVGGRGTFRIRRVERGGRRQHPYVGGDRGRCPGCALRLPGCPLGWQRPRCVEESGGLHHFWVVA